MKVVNLTYDSQTVDLDYHDFHKCTFNNCTLIYHGYGNIGLSECKINNCKWTFSDASVNTLKFMTLLYHNGGKELIESTFDNIRKGQHP